MKEGLKRMEKVRFIPEAVCQVFPRCPRPANWLEVTTTVPSGNADFGANSNSNVLVD
jgi:hypothetical protein